MRFRPFLLLASLFVVAASSCSDSPTLPTLASLAGHYELRSVNGTPLPWPVGGGGTLEAGEFDIAPDGTFETRGRYLVAQGLSRRSSGDFDAGTVTVSGSSIDVRYASGSQASGTLDGAKLILTFPSGGSFGYERNDALREPMIRFDRANYTATRSADGRSIVRSDEVYVELFAGTSALPSSFRIVMTPNVPCSAGGKLEFNAFSFTFVNLPAGTRGVGGNTLYTVCPVSGDATGQLTTGTFDIAASYLENGKTYTATATLTVQ